MKGTGIIPGGEYEDSDGEDDEDDDKDEEDENEPPTGAGTLPFQVR